MSKATLLTLVTIIAALAISFVVMRSMNPTPAGEQADNNSGEARWLNEAIQCAAYYDLSAQILSGMDVPQMAAVAGRLATSAEQARNLANGQADAASIDQRIMAAQSEMRAAMPDQRSLGPLMSQYKGPCQSLMTDPNARLAYWQQQAG
ncbi:hypothetical protein [Ferrimonas balearica]|uniref:hypothetical protein n=1 Tax=Ferrimonas balearica TaxID=44012 RepID=UPI001F3BC14F|nr:hypothetical protein [Ferrimonas balearica]MBY6016366.1 hypothetical protein [Halomonas denitrificans]MBY6095364.1 hypothetical protein [Ferrimonas balearica]